MVARPVPRRGLWGWHQRLIDHDTAELPYLFRRIYVFRIAYHKKKEVEIQTENDKGKGSVWPYRKVCVLLRREVGPRPCLPSA